MPETETAPPPARVAMITGASRGIGLAIAERLAASGWRLSLGVRRPAETATPPGSLVVPYDAEQGGEEAWVAATVEAFGRVDAVICNAGIMIPKTVVEASEAEMAQLFAVNVHAPQRLARAAWPHLKATGRGRVVVTSSLSGLRVYGAASGAYSMTKFAVLALAHGLRHAGFEDGIRATAICPGFVATDMAMALTEMPPAEMTQPEDIATIVEMVLDQPNTTSLPVIAVNCRVDGNY